MAVCVYVRVKQKTNIWGFFMPVVLCSWIFVRFSCSLNVPWWRQFGNRRLTCVTYFFRNRRKRRRERGGWERRTGSGSETASEKGSGRETERGNEKGRGSESESEKGRRRGSENGRGKGENGKRSWSGGLVQVPEEAACEGHALSQWKAAEWRKIKGIPDLGKCFEMMMTKNKKNNRNR